MFRYYSIFVWLWVGWHKYKAGKHAKLLLVALIRGLNKINILMHACIKWKVSQVAIGCMKSGTTIQPIQLVAVLKMMKVLLWKRWRGEKLCGKSFFYEIFRLKTVWSNNVHMDRERDGFHWTLYTLAATNTNCYSKLRGVQQTIFFYCQWCLHKLKPFKKQKLFLSKYCTKKK